MNLCKLVLLILMSGSCVNGQINDTAKIHLIEMKGITSVGTPRPFKANPYPDIISTTGINWICLVPYGYIRQGKQRVIYNSDRQWWGERPEGVIENIKYAKEHKLHILLKPQVFSWRMWTGDFGCETEEEWQIWETTYTTYILQMADIAEAYKVEAFCLGTEYKRAVRERPEFWYGLIDQVRERFSGRLTYAANWDNYKNIPFWDQLDFIGINAYFPLTESETPTVDELTQAWQPIVSKMTAFAKEHEREIAFTEWGYMTLDQAAWQTWKNEEHKHEKGLNQQAQANAYDALLQTFSQEQWWLGGFVWKWFPEGMGGEGYDHKDYTPQDKLAHKVLARHYGQ